jgi:hypothetical protein
VAVYDLMGTTDTIHPHPFAVPTDQNNRTHAKSRDQSSGSDESALRRIDVSNFEVGRTNR